MGLSGIRYFSFVIIPLVLSELSEFIIANYKNDKFEYNKKQLFWIIIFLVFSLIGYFTYKMIIYPKTIALSEGVVNATLIEGNEVAENLNYLIVVLLDVFGCFLGTGTSITSIQGITQLLVIVGVIIIYFLIVIYGIKYRSEKKLNNLLLFAFWMFAINIYFLAFTTLGKEWNRLLEPHYLAIAMFLVLPLSSACLKYIDINKALKGCLIVILLTMVVCFDVNKLKDRNDTTPDYIPVLEEKGYKFGYSTNYWNCNNITVFTNGEIRVATYYVDENGEFTFRRWGTLDSYQNRTPEFYIIDVKYNDYVKDSLGEKCSIIYKDDSVIIYGT